MTPTWRTSSYSNANNGNCVEVADRPTGVAVRDTKARAAGTLTVPASSWRALLIRL